jgi:hypothetical protein
MFNVSTTGGRFIEKRCIVHRPYTTVISTLVNFQVSLSKQSTCDVNGFGLECQISVYGTGVKNLFSLPICLGHLADQRAVSITNLFLLIVSSGWCRLTFVKPSTSWYGFKECNKIVFSIVRTMHEAKIQFTKQTYMHWNVNRIDTQSPACFSTSWVQCWCRLKLCQI